MVCIYKSWKEYKEEMRYLIYKVTELLKDVKVIEIPIPKAIIKCVEAGPVVSKHGKLGPVVRARGAGSPTDR